MGLRRAWSFEVSECISRGYWKQFLISHPYEHSQNLPVVEGDTLPRGKSVPPPHHLNHGACLHFYVMNRRECEEPGHLKFLNALQEEAWINFSYLVPMNIVNVERGGGGVGGGAIYPGVKCPTPPPQPSCMLSFLCDDQRDWEEPGHLTFLNALQEGAGNNFSYLVPMKIVNRGERGDSLPRGKVSPPPSTLLYAFIFM